MPLTGVSENVENSLKTRVASLEARVAHLEEELDRSSGSAVPPQFREAIDAIYGDGKKRPGPEEKIDQSELLQRRDNLVEWLEERWPEIVKPLLAAKNPRKAATVPEKRSTAEGPTVRMVKSVCRTSRPLVGVHK